MDVRLDVFSFYKWETQHWHVEHIIENYSNYCIAIIDLLYSWILQYAVSDWIQKKNGLHSSVLASV